MQVVISVHLSDKPPNIGFVALPYKYYKECENSEILHTAGPSRQFGPFKVGDSSSFTRFRYVIPRVDSFKVQASDCAFSVFNNQKEFERKDAGELDSSS